jgi:hypothetical protein
MPSGFSFRDRRAQCRVIVQITEASMNNTLNWGCLIRFAGVLMILFVVAKWYFGFNIGFEEVAIGVFGVAAMVV